MSVPLLPERILSHIRVKPDSLQPGDVYQAGDGHRWRVRWHCYSHAATGRHNYLMERVTGAGRGEIRALSLTALWNAKLVGGHRFEYARRHVHPDMHVIGFETICNSWGVQIA